MGPQQSPWENDKWVSSTIYLWNERPQYRTSKTTPNEKWKKNKTPSQGLSRKSQTLPQIVAGKVECTTFLNCTWQHASNIHSFKMLFISWPIISRTVSWGDERCAQRYIIYGYSFTMLLSIKRNWGKCTGLQIRDLFNNFITCKIDHYTVIKSDVPEEL